MMRKYIRRTSKKYWGFNHFDWSYIEMHHAGKKNSHENDRRLKRLPIVKRVEGHADVGRTADVITFLRHPVSRSISQFYFGQTLPWARKQNSKFLHQTIEEYVHDVSKDWFQPLSDGEGGVDFLAGIFHDGWVMTDQVESEAKDYLRHNKTAACLLAAQRLEQTVWFGLLEDVERSMKLLQISLGLDQTPVLPQRNAAKHEYPVPSDEIKMEIERQLPKDMWLYEFAKRLFEARWNYFMPDDGEHEYIPPELPPLPQYFE
jgi:hypothetical protein